MRVHVPTTWDRLVAPAPGPVLPAGSTGYAVTDALAEALGLPSGLAGAGSQDLEDLASVAADAAAEASLLLLAGSVTTDPARGASRAPAEGVAGVGAPRRAVLVVEAAASPAPGATHPGEVVFDGDVTWAQVGGVLADDVTDVPVVAAALRLAVTDHEAGLARLEPHVLGWYDPSELGSPGGR